MTKDNSTRFKIEGINKKTTFWQLGTKSARIVI